MTTLMAPKVSTMSSMLVPRTHEGILLPIEVVDIICRAIGVEVRLEDQREYLTTCTLPYENSSNDVLGP